MSVDTLTAQGSIVHGVLSSLATISVCHPLFTIKTRQMIKKLSPPEKEFIGPSFPPEEKLSVKVLYRGYAANQFCDITYVAVAYFANNFFKHTIMKDKPLTTGELFLGGIFSGIMASPLQAILERVMVVQQAAKESMTAQEAIVSICKHGGPMGMLRGITPTVLRESINCSSLFALSKTIEPVVVKAFGGSEKVSPVAYLVSGLIAGFLTTPFDRCKTLMQEDVKGAISMRMAYKIVLAEGYRALFRGATARMATIGATTASLGFLGKVLPPCLPSSLHSDRNSQMH